MRIFFDTNILLDIVEQREPHFESSKAALVTCGRIGAEIVLAWHSLSNAFYIYARKAGRELAREALKDALAYMTVVSVGHTEALRAFNLAFDDLEDAMQAATAEAAWADFIVTRDKNDYAASPVQALTPDEFIARFSVSP